LGGPWGSLVSLWLREPLKIRKEEVEEYLSLLEVNGLSDRWIYAVRHHLVKYLDFTGWKIDRTRTLDYLKIIKERTSTSYYRKITYQIRKFLNYLGIEWANDIKPPAEPEYNAKRITKEDILRTIEYFRGNPYFPQLKALILLGASSGLRAEEMYKLTLEDIDLENRIVYIRHDPKNGKTTKTGKSRISFFSREAQEALTDYLDFFKRVKLKKLFSQSHIERLFRNAPIRVKDLRKFFSQEWDRRGGPTSIKKILMGHSLKNDVDLMHYNNQSKDDLKAIYNRVMQDLHLESILN